MSLGGPHHCQGTVVVNTVNMMESDLILIISLLLTGWGRPVETQIEKVILMIDWHCSEPSLI